MFNLHIVQALYGDCFILEYGTVDAPRYILIDGGPKGVYEENLRPVLQRIADKGGSLEFAILSHVDDDHIAGLLDLLEEIQQQRDSDRPETVAIGEIWHNSFSQTLGGDVEARFNSFMRRAAPVRGTMNNADRATRDIAKGDELTRAASALGIPINEEFDPSNLVSLGLANEPVERENLSMWIVAPNQTNLQNLKQEWLDWLEEQEDRVLVRGMEEAERAAARADNRVPNLSSIIFLAKADGKSVLLTGDGRADHLLDGLQKAGLLDASGKLHVDVLKLPHHGSRHNISKEFLQTVTADQYVVSASGRYNHPSQQTLEWIAEVAQEQGRTVEIILTNHTPSVDHLLEGYDTEEYGYSLIEMPEGDQVMVVELGDAEVAEKPVELDLDAAFAVAPRVLVLSFDPIIRSEGGRTVRELLGWNDPRELAQKYIADLAECSGGYLRYQIAEWRDLDAWPVKMDGFRYNEESFLRAWRARTGFHQPDSADYEALLEEHKILEEVDSGRIDEVWLFSFPYAGFYESSMIGPGALWCNAPPMERRDVSRRFVIMAFNYERGVGPMLESFGHRVESLLKHEWQDFSGEDNLWERFSRYDKVAPGQAGCGTMHFAPNSVSDYDWGNTRKVPSTCDDWLDFPHLQGVVREVDCSEWGNGEMRAHHEWWLRHLPCAAGQTNGKLNNWWACAVDDSAAEVAQTAEVPTSNLGELLAELAKNAPSRILGPLRRGREEEKAIQRRRLAALLGETGEAGAVGALVNLLEDDPDRIVRRVAAEALGELGDAQAVEPLISALRDEDGDVRAAVARTLRGLGDARAVEPLRQATADPDPGVRMAAANALEQLQPDLTPGTIFAGKYEIMEELEPGGLTDKYRARDVSSGHDVRLTVVRDPPDAAEFADRFKEEAEAFARLQHPGLVRVLDSGVEAGRSFLVRQLVGDERTLRDLLAGQGPLPLERALPILDQVASALDYLHVQDPPILYLHLKPSHVLLEGEGDNIRAVLTDSVTTRAWQATSDGLVATPGYISPEQASGAPLSPQSDVYGLGLIAYEMLAGRPPFTGDAVALLKAHAEEPPRPPQEFVPVLSDNASAAILKALAKDTDERCASAGAFVAELQVREPLAAPLIYHDFVLLASEIQQDADGEHFSVRVLSSPVGEGESVEQVTIPPSLWSQLRDLERRRLDVEEMIELGQVLANLLLPAQARTLLDRSRAVLGAREGLRIRLRIDDQRLANIPWEYLHVPGPGVPPDRPGPAGFLALDPRVSLVRHQPMLQPAVSPEPVSGPLRMAALLANPDTPEYPALDLEAERRIIERAMGDVPGIEVQFFPGGTVRDLEGALMAPPHILHFAGHSQWGPTASYEEGEVDFEAALVLVGEDGGAESFPVEKLAVMLAGRGIRLVVLNAAQTARSDDYGASSNVAEALIRAGIPAVMDMQYPMRDANAIAFSRGFYEALAAGETIDAAVTTGRQAIVARSGPEDRDWGAPVLDLRTPDGVLFPEGVPETEDTQKAEWTILVYMAADNNLADFANTNLTQILETGSTSQVSLLVLCDQLDGATRYVVGSSESETVREPLGEFDSGSSDSLLETMRWAFKQCPAENYGLVLWGHGSSQVPQRILNDDGTGSSVDTLALTRVLREVMQFTDAPLGFLGMDTSYMATLEVAYELRETARYMVASEAPMPGAGWPYGTILGALRDAPGTSPRDLAVLAVNRYAEYRSSVGAGSARDGPTLVVLDLSQTEELARAVDELAGALLSDVVLLPVALWSAGRNAIKFGHNEWFDLKDLAEKLAAQASSPMVEDAVDEIQEMLQPGGPVVLDAYLAESAQGMCGVGIYLPAPPAAISPFYADLALSQDTRWDELLEVYHEEAPPLRFWFVTANPEQYDWDRAFEAGSEEWTQVRGTEAQQNLRRARPGDVVLAYRSTPDKYVTGLGHIAGEPYEFEDEDEVRYAVRIEMELKLETGIKLDELRQEVPDLQHVTRRRPLSFSPVTEAQWTTIRNMILERNPDLASSDLPPRYRIEIASVGMPAECAAGDPIQVTLRLRNQGNLAWREGDRLIVTCDWLTWEEANATPTTPTARLPRRDDDRVEYNLRAIRQLLLEGFDQTELRALVRYDDQLSALDREFAPADSIPELVDETIVWCERRGLIPYLVQRIKQVRPEKYKQFEAQLARERPPAHG